jgi:hypothetical protein
MKSRWAWALLLVVAVGYFGAVRYWPDSQGDWEVEIAPDPSVPAGWVEARSGARSIDGFRRTFIGWDLPETTDPLAFQSVSLSIDEYEGTRAAKRHSDSPDVAAPNFDPRTPEGRRIPLEDADGYVACGDGTPESCLNWYYFARHGRFWVTVVYENYVEAPMTRLEFIDFARGLYVAERVDE